MLALGCLMMVSPVTSDIGFYQGGHYFTASLRPRSLYVVRIREGATLIWHGVPARWRPWRLAVVDLDADGRQEIVVALNKPTKYIPRRHETLFVYSFDGRQVWPKWKGSTLGRRFTDFAFANIFGKARLITIDVLIDGKKRLVVRTWNGFGFKANWEWGAWKSAYLCNVQAGH